jgi:nucleoside-diphosphate-sugar epimerase
VVDQNENYLADLVRDLRGRPGGIPEIDFRTLPIDYGSRITEKLLVDADPYDVVLNFAAIKHVRSEKDIYSLLQMIDTNIVKHIRFKREMAKYGHGKTYFAVSTDKAANPTSLMGATKRLMEDLIFAFGVPSGGSTTSARFANVAFSNGSILQAFARRMALRQPIAVPRDTRRYFVSRQEAGEICLLSAFAVPNEHVAYPRMDPKGNLQLLEDVAARFLRHHGFEPKTYCDHDLACSEVDQLITKGHWPLLLTPLDTSGEKPYEEFVGLGEAPVDIGLNSLQAVQHVQSCAVEGHLFERLEQLIVDPLAHTSKTEVVDLISKALSNFQHVETGRNLDQRF